MKLSDAIMLGSTTGLSTFNPSGWNTCLIGVGINAFGGERKSGCNVLTEAQDRWPWLRLKVHAPSHWTDFDYRGRFSQVTGGYSFDALHIVSAWAMRIYEGIATLEEAVDWIRSVEPQEEPARAQEQPQLETVNV